MDFCRIVFLYESDFKEEELKTRIEPENVCVKITGEIEKFFGKKLVFLRRIETKTNCSIIEHELFFGQQKTLKLT